MIYYFLLHRIKIQNKQFFQKLVILRYFNLLSPIDVNSFFMYSKQEKEPESNQVLLSFKNNQLSLKLPGPISLSKQSTISVGMVRNMDDKFRMLSERIQDQFKAFEEVIFNKIAGEISRIIGKQSKKKDDNKEILMMKNQIREVQTDIFALRKEQSNKYTQLSKQIEKVNAAHDQVEKEIKKNQKNLKKTQQNTGSLKNQLTKVKQNIESLFRNNQTFQNKITSMNYELKKYQSTIENLRREVLQEINTCSKSLDQKILQNANGLLKAQKKLSPKEQIYRPRVSTNYIPSSISSNNLNHLRETLGSPGNKQFKKRIDFYAQFQKEDREKKKKEKDK